jgi:antitoxin (DNA-binding transcriptional repressor) of toxin-antitoxin stability system
VANNDLPERHLFDTSSAADKVASRSYLDAMRAVGLKTLKNRLSEYVRLVANGETVLVTDRDRVVAELSPPRAGRSELVGDAMLAEAVRRGWVTPPVLGGGAAPPRKPIAALRTLMEELRQDRDDR